MWSRFTADSEAREESDVDEGDWRGLSPGEAETETEFEDDVESTARVTGCW